jgi:hypothetical protein
MTVAKATILVLIDNSPSSVSIGRQWAAGRDCAYR